MSKKISLVIGLAAIVLLYALNISHAIDNYGILENTLSAKVLAQADCGGNGGDGGCGGNGDGCGGNGDGCGGNGGDGFCPQGRGYEKVIDGCLKHEFSFYWCVSHRGHGVCLEGCIEVHWDYCNDATSSESCLHAEACW